MFFPLKRFSEGKGEEQGGSVKGWYHSHHSVHARLVLAKLRPSSTAKMLHPPAQSVAFDCSLDTSSHRLSKRVFIFNQHLFMRPRIAFQYMDVCNDQIKVTGVFVSQWTISLFWIDCEFSLLILKSSLLSAIVILSCCRTLEVISPLQSTSPPCGHPSSTPFPCYICSVTFP